MVIAIVKVTGSVGQVDGGNCHSRTWYIASKYRVPMPILCERVKDAMFGHRLSLVPRRLNRLL